MSIPSEEYPILIVKADGKVYAIIKELSIIESGQDVLQVFEKAEKRKNELLSQFHEAHLEGFLAPSLTTEKVKVSKRFSWFSLLNGAVIAIILTIPILAITQPLSGLITKVSHLIGRVSETPPIDQIVAIQHRIQNMPAARKQELKEALHVIVSEAAPFTGELCCLFEKPSVTIVSNHSIDE